MSARSDLVVGWCPGALQPMEAGDGLIVRIRPRLSRLSLVQLETLAAAALRFGDGSLYLSNRANVQLRAVSPDEHEALLEVLDRAGLIDCDAGAEAVRNIMVSPAVELSAHAGLTAGLASRLEDLIARKEALHRLPAKFGIALQAGDKIDTAAMSDVTFIVQGDEIALVLDGAPGRAFLAGGTRAAVEAYERVAIAFIKFRHAQPAIRRMRDAIAHFGVEGVLQEAHLPLVAHGLPLEEAPALVGDLGEAFGLAFTFGEIGRDSLTELTVLMRWLCIAEAGISPNRALVFPVREEEEKAALIDLAKRIDAITDPNDIRLRMHGCPGTPACRRATVAARQDAEATLRALAGEGFTGAIHISGCEKRCAYPHDADITAIGADGSYTVTGPGGRILNQVAGADLPKAIAELAKTA